MRDFEPPSATEGYTVSFDAKKMWRKMKEDAKEKRKKGVKTSAREQRKKAAQGAQVHVHKSVWVGLIQEYHDDTSVGKKVFKEVHPEMKNH